jgi:glycosyltransferase involved in cell wall biosynthesis
VAREDVPGLLWAADAVVHAGLREGLARVLPQAGLCGRPVVTFNVGGAAEVVRDGSNGYLLPPPPAGREPRRAEDSVAALAEAMAALAADPSAARAMGGRWPAEVLDRFGYRRATREIQAVYGRAGRV